ncbi:DUF4901 domain-containing protein [Brevibacillus ruminantium]|uniref:DUF4901 domain-containing protein n=1 Tax=Brevibacillus ruminantium TaxID=2950604 RepID=A0ABY4WCW7_9BACL|nr:DUF4901 domain-containing protein [Brevibacillus ruminantium]USG64912.1 DUF4901 domain-containing protein [Brevibacillus ruminantium]
MSLPDEEKIEQYLRRYRTTVPVPRTEWVRVGEEQLARQARKVARIERVRKVTAYSVCTASAILLSVWIQGGTLQIQTGEDTVTTAERPHIAATIPQPEGLSTIPVQEVSSGSGQPGEGQLPKEGIAPGENPLFPKSGKGIGKEHPNPAGVVAAAEGTKQGNQNVMVEQAEQYLREKLGEDSKEYRFNPARSRLGEGIVAFSQILHGISLDESSLIVTVDKANQPVGLELHPLGASEPQTPPLTSSKQALINPADAAQKLADSLRLVYVAGEKNALRYQPLQVDAVDARTGALNANPAVETHAVEPKGKRLYAGDAQGAALLLREEFGLEMQAGLKPFILINGANKEYVWEWDGGHTARILLDGEGNLLSFTRKLSAASVSKGHVMGEEEAKRIAVSHLSRYLPAGIEQLASVTVSQDQQQTLFRFYRLHQGIPVVNHVYDVTVDTNRGIVTGLAGPFGKSMPQLPKAEGILSLDEAKKAFAAHVQLEPVYRTGKQEEQSDTGMQLVYPYPQQNEKPLSIDAKSGALIYP